MHDEIVLNSVLVKRKVSRPVGCSKDQKRSFRRKRVEITRLTMALFIYKLFQDIYIYIYEWRSTVIKSKEEQERIMIACHASPEGKSSGLARIQNFKPINIVRQSNTSEEGGGGGAN